MIGLPSEPNEASSEASVRGDILAVATRLFADRGFDGTSLQAIADRVGVRKPSVLYHFRSKEILREKVLQRLLAHWRDALPRLLKAGTSGEDRFLGIVGEVVRFFSADPSRARLLLREALDRPAFMREVFTDFFAPLMGLVADSIKRGQREGLVLANVDAEAYVLHIFQLVVGSIGTVSVTDGVLGGDAREALDRCTREVVRMARSSLFRPEANERGGKHGQLL